MDDLRSEVQALQKVLGHVHKVWGKKLSEENGSVRLCPGINVSLFSPTVFIVTQLVGGEVDGGKNSFSSPSSSPAPSSPLHARSPLRNATVMAVQSALSKHQHQVQVSAASLLIADVLKFNSSTALIRFYRTQTCM